MEKSHTHAILGKIRTKGSVVILLESSLVVLQVVQVRQPSQPVIRIYIIFSFPIGSTICTFQKSEKQTILQVFKSQTHPANLPPIFILVTIFDEIFKSENVKQVYAIVTEWLPTLEVKEQRKIKSNILRISMQFQYCIQVHIV